MEEIDLADATLNQIAKWVRQFKLPGKLVDLFDSRKLKAPYFFIDSKAAEKARTTELRDLKFTPLEITAINNNIQENKSRAVSFLAWMAALRRGIVLAPLPGI
jgi:hypothetical protein